MLHRVQVLGWRRLCFAYACAAGYASHTPAIFLGHPSLGLFRKFAHQGGNRNHGCRGNARQKDGQADGFGDQHAGAAATATAAVAAVAVILIFIIAVIAVAAVTTMAAAFVIAAMAMAAALVIAAALVVTAAFVVTAALVVFVLAAAIFFLFFTHGTTPLKNQSVRHSREICDSMKKPVRQSRETIKLPDRLTGERFAAQTGENRHISSQRKCACE